MTPTPITLQGLRKTYGTFTALDDVSLDIRPGEFLTLLGPSGSGKTTLLMALAGFVRPEAGRIAFGATDITRLAPNKRDIGFVFQNYALFPHMNVLANVTYPLKLRNVPKATARDRAMAALARVQLDSFAERDIAALSGGQRQRVALARAIVFEPRVMLMDEPLSALDKNLREKMQFEIRKLHDDLGITTIYVTHDQREALTMSDRIAVMDAGRIQQIDAPQTIYHHPETEFIARFMGEANILPGDVLRDGQGQPLDPAIRMIRAESFSLAPGDGTGRVTLTGTVIATAFRGENWMITLELAGADDVTLSIPAAQSASCGALRPGDSLTAYADAGFVHVLQTGRAA